jgi:glucose/mannose transport system substrate-binding protein
MLRKALLAGVAFATLGALAVQAAEEVEVIHWWTSGGEAAALRVLRQNLEKEGVAWKDAAIAGSGGDQARILLQARMVAGNPPTAIQRAPSMTKDQKIIRAKVGLLELAKVQPRSG